ncbi:MAG TPA: hypothetical protein VM307_04655 [Egibacteraceae bacterium]|nr:hypothetical protein [Egibacteraceae bacterium]
MFKRLFFAMLGLGAGVAIGVVVVRKVERAQRAMRPDNLAASAAARAGGVRGRLAAAVDQGRAAAQAKEAELRAVYRAGSAPRES